MKKRLVYIFAQQITQNSLSLANKANYLISEFSEIRKGDLFILKDQGDTIIERGDIVNLALSNAAHEQGKALFKSSAPEPVPGIHCIEVAYLTADGRIFGVDTDPYRLSGTIASILRANGG